MFAFKLANFSIHLFVIFFFLAFTVELNEIGFKFVRKCINYIETNGKKAD